MNGRWKTDESKIFLTEFSSSLYPNGDICRGAFKIAKFANQVVLRLQELSELLESRSSTSINLLKSQLKGISAVSKLSSLRACYLLGLRSFVEFFFKKIYLSKYQNLEADHQHKISYC